MAAPNLQADCRGASGTVWKKTTERLFRGARDMHVKWRQPMTFKVTRKTPELISPAEPTPHEIKFLSDIDDQDALRVQVLGIHFYKKNPSMEGKDPVNIIRNAVSKALVFYYPFAGRLREHAGRKLVVECTGEGVVFIEADADVMLEQFGEALYPPFPNFEELLYNVPGSDGITNSPLLLIQVTRLRCGGFIIAYRINHTMCDGVGFIQFVYAVLELACGAAAPSILPIWERQLLSARHPPRVSFAHREYDDVVMTNESGTSPIPLDNMVHRYFFFGPNEISALRRSLPPHLQSCSKFDVVAACTWRCQTIALSPNPDEEVRFFLAVDVRNKMTPPIPMGYYGNCVVFPVAITTAGKLCENPLGYAVELVRKAKYQATDEYARSVADLIVVRGRPSVTLAMTYAVSDLTHSVMKEVDFGWGKATYAGIAKPIDENSGAAWYLPFKNKMGEDGIMVPVYLPLNAMEQFNKHLQIIITNAP